MRYNRFEASGLGDRWAILKGKSLEESPDSAGQRAW
jgi:hypothetical protein